LSEKIKIVAAQTNDSWMETCLISVSKIGGSELAAHGITETVDIDDPDKDFDSVALVNGGRVKKWTPQGDGTITFEAYPLEAGTDTGSTLKGWDDLKDVVDSTVPIRVLNSHTRNLYRVLVMWTNDPTVTAANQITTSTYSAYRYGAADGYFTSVKKSFTDGIMKFTCIFKFAPFDKANSPCILSESCAGTTPTDILPAIAAYTATNRFG
jgi:hypothetical protein